MYLEWDSPAHDAYSDIGYRTFINNFHEKITSAGTGITHMNNLAGQFNLDSGTLPSSIIVGSSLYKGLPLYYKYECVGKKTIYFTFRFDYTPNSSPSIGVRSILGYHAFTDRLNASGYPDNSKFINISNNNTIQFSEYYNTPGYIPSVSSSFRYGTGQSFILSKPDGTLIIQYNMGCKTDSVHDPMKSTISVIINSGVDDITSIGLYDSTTSILSTNNSDTISGGITMPARAALVANFKQVSFTKTKIYNLSIPPNNNFIPVYYYDTYSAFKSMNNVFYYDTKMITGSGIVQIGDDTLYLSGDMVEGLSITNSTTTKYGFAFKVN